MADSQRTFTPPAPPVDWSAAARLAARVAGPGPTITSVEAAAVVDQLRSCALAAGPFVAGITQLTAPPVDSAGVLIVDRPRWLQGAVSSLGTLLDPVVAQVMADRGTAWGATITRKVLAQEAGLVLGFVCSRVLGQFDPFAPTPRLLLVAPNIVAAERELGVNPHDFRLWVCLHEETHRFQFMAHPWLGDHIRARITAVASELLHDPDRTLAQWGQVVRSLTRPESVRDSAGNLTDDPQVHRQGADLTAIMSLLEGHADVVMDAVGPAVVPSVAEIRRRFNQRRSMGRGAVDRLLRRLLGLEAKTQQYVQGAAFVRAVTEAVGTAGFNAVWTGARTLPTAAEIANPTAWVRRVHG